MSANSDADSKLAAKEAGMDYFLEKPFTISDFRTLIGEISEDFSEYREYGGELMINSCELFPSIVPLPTISPDPSSTNLAALSISHTNTQDISSSMLMCPAPLYSSFSFKRDGSVVFEL